MAEPNFAQAVADPIVQVGLLALAGMAVTRAILRNRPQWRLIVHFAFLAALTALLLYHRIVPYEPGPISTSALEAIFIGIAKIIWWITAALVLIAFVRAFLNFERRPREGRLLQDLIVGIIYLGASLSIIANVFGAPIGTLIATSGVLAIILGLAMQSTLSDVFSGLALNLGRPYALGDWIVLSNGIEGRVVDTNWRATYLLNGDNDLVVVPNSDLAKARLTNLSSLDRSHGVTITVRVAPTTSPAAVLEVMRSVLLSSTSILREGSGAAVKSLDAHAIEVDLNFRVGDFASAPPARSEVFDLIFRHLKAAGLELSPPPQAPGPAIVPSRLEPSKAAARSTPLRLLDALPLFASLTEDEKEALASTMVRRTYAKGAVVVEQGTVLKSLMIVRAGVLLVTRHEASHEMELARLAPGDFFGESGLLTAAGEPGTIRALTFVVVYEIAQAGLAPLLRDRPGMAADLGVVLARRAAAGKRQNVDDKKVLDPGAVSFFVERIRRLFELPRED